MNSTVTLSKGGTAERTVEIHSLTIPNLWHIGTTKHSNLLPEDQKMILECWHIAHDLKQHIIHNS